MYHTLVVHLAQLIGPIAASVLLLMAAPAAHAGTYKLYTCNVPGKPTQVPSTAPWSVSLDGVNSLHFDECTSGGSFGIGLNVRSMRAYGEASLVLARPAQGPKSAIGIVRYRTWITAELSGSGAPAFVDVGGACGPPGCVTPDHAPWVSVPYSQTNPSVSIRLHCSAGDCAFDSTRPLQVRGVEVDLYEDVPPTGEIEGGTLLTAGGGSGQRTVSVSGTDQESGVAMLEALLGDIVVARQNLASNPAMCAHTELNACPARYGADLVVDTTTVPPGEYPLALRITDAAGNRRVVTAAKPILIGSGAGSVPSARLSASFVRSRATHTTNFGRSVRVYGRLTAQSGHPIGQARIAVTETTATSAPQTLSGSVTTGADGTFVYSASGRRPSRSINFAYVTPGAPTASRQLRLYVRAASTFRVSMRGVNVRYSGRVVTRPLPAGGKRVYIQGRAAGSAWQRFAARRTDKRGRFSGRYRLRVRRPGVRLQFRVEIPSQSGYAFAPRTGDAVTRVVR